MSQYGNMNINYYRKLVVVHLTNQNILSQLVNRIINNATTRSIQHTYREHENWRK